MCCRIVELKDKQVVSIKDGCVIGFVCDVEIDTCDGRLVSIVVCCRSRGIGLFGREDDLVIPWDKIEVIGCDSILVCYEPIALPRKKRSGFSSLFFGE